MRPNNSFKATAGTGRRIEVETADSTIAGHFLKLLHGVEPKTSWVRTMHTSLNLYAEHEFNASTFAARVIAGTDADIFSSIVGAIGALRGPKHGGPTKLPSKYKSGMRRPMKPRPTCAPV